MMVQFSARVHVPQLYVWNAASVGRIWMVSASFHPPLSMTWSGEPSRFRSRLHSQLSGCSAALRMYVPGAMSVFMRNIPSLNPVSNVSRAAVAHAVSGRLHVVSTVMLSDALWRPSSERVLTVK